MERRNVSLIHSKVAGATLHLNMWCRVAVYSHPGSAHNAVRYTFQKHWDGWPVEFTVNRDDNGYGVYARWAAAPDGLEVAKREPDRIVSELSSAAPKRRIDVTVQRINAARGRQGVNVAEYATAAAARVAANRTLPRRFKHERVTFKARSVDRRHYVYATWEGGGDD